MFRRLEKGNKDFMKKYEKRYIAHFEFIKNIWPAIWQTGSEALRLIKVNHCLSSSKMMILLETKGTWKP